MGVPTFLLYDLHVLSFNLQLTKSAFAQVLMMCSSLSANQQLQRWKLLQRTQAQQDAFRECGLEVRWEVFHHLLHVLCHTSHTCAASLPQAWDERRQQTDRPKGKEGFVLVAASSQFPHQQHCNCDNLNFHTRRQQQCNCDNMIFLWVQSVSNLGEWRICQQWSGGADLEVFVEWFRQKMASTCPWLETWLALF